MKTAQKKKKRCKEIRRIKRRILQIYSERHELGYRELEKPIRYGWVKEFVLTAQLERYPKIQVELEEIFGKVQRSFWGRTKEDCERHWNNQVSEHLIIKNRPTLSRKSFNKLSPEAQKLCVSYRFYEKKKSRIRFYVLYPRPVCKIKFTRAYVTHSKIIDPNLESELEQLTQLLNRPENYGMSHRGDSRYRRMNWNIPNHKRDRFKSREYLGSLKNINASDRSKWIELWEKNSKGKI